MSLQTELRLTSHLQVRQVETDPGRFEFVTDGPIGEIWATSADELMVKVQDAYRVYHKHLPSAVAPSAGGTAEGAPIRVGVTAPTTIIHAKCDFVSVQSDEF